MIQRALMTILVWGLILEILAVIYLSSTPWKFEFAYTLFLLMLTSIALVFVIWRLKSSARKVSPRNVRTETPASSDCRRENPP